MISKEEIWVNENAAKTLGVKSEDLVTTQLLTIIDEFDEIVIKDILGIYNHQNSMIVLDAHKKGVFEKAHKHIINMCFALVSINTHRRNYISKLEQARERAIKEMESWGSPFDTSLYNQEITIEVIGCLMNFKTALDSLAQAVGVIYGFNSSKTWGNNGSDILNVLRNNITNKDKLKAERLKRFIDSHQHITKDYIDLRNNLGHGLTEYKNTISGFFKRKTDDIIQDPRVEVNKKVFDCCDLVNGCVKLCGEYCREILVIILSNMIPGIYIGNLNGRYVWSQEIIAVQVIKTD